VFIKLVSTRWEVETMQSLQSMQEFTAKDIIHGPSSDADNNLAFTIGPLKARKIRIQHILRDLHRGIGIPALRPPLSNAAPEGVSGCVEEDQHDPRTRLLG
jgi:hypothetical protein